MTAGGRGSRDDADADRWLVHVGAGASASDLLRCARTAGLETLVFDRDPKAPSARWATQFAPLSREDQAGLVEAARHHQTTAALAGAATTSAAPAALRAAAAIREATGLPGEPLASIDLLLDRSAWKERLRQAGVATPASEVLEHSAELRRFLWSHPQAVLKPAGASNGSLGVAFVGLRAPGLERLFRRVQRHSPSGAVLAEAQCSGPEYSLDGYVQDSQAKLLLRSRKYAERRGEATLPVGYAWGDASEYPAAARCETLLQTVAGALGLTSTLLSLDVIESGGELQVIDAGLQLDAKIDAVLASLGFDLPGLQLALALGEPAALAPPSAAVCGALRFFYAEERGAVERGSAAWTGEAPGSHFGWLQPPSAIAGPPSAVTEAVCWALFGGASAAEAWQRARAMAPKSFFTVKSVAASSRSEGALWIRS